ncbi:MAG: hypothetical protein A2Y40_05665 [Candidatus Margulisbacteria bacterium GWF2_35_9]|nr:MAG: hypothetical protein A2Y40_05665 [Candidatus Margulisbacteria bacterium GWF2_35_9]
MNKLIFILFILTISFCANIFTNNIKSIKTYEIELKESFGEIVEDSKSLIHEQFFDISGNSIYNFSPSHNIGSDSGIFNKYEDGKLIESIIYPSIASPAEDVWQWLNMGFTPKKTYSWSDKPNQLIDIKYDWGKNKTQIVSIYDLLAETKLYEAKYEFDSIGNTISVTISQNDDFTYSISCKYYQNYPIEIKGIDSKKLTNSLSRNKYDEKNRLIEIKDFSETGDVSSITRYSYKKNEKRGTMFLGDKLYLDETTIFNSKNLPITRKIQEYEDGLPLPYKRIINAKYKNDKVIETYISYEVNKSLVLKTFKESLNLFQLAVIMPQLVSKSLEEIFIEELGDDNDKSVEVIYLKNNELPKEKQIHNYDKKGNIAEIKKYILENKFGADEYVHYSTIFYDNSYYEINELSQYSTPDWLENLLLNEHSSVFLPQSEWAATSEVDPLTDKKEVSFSLKSSSGVGKYGDNIYLVIRFNDNEPEVYINWHSYLGDSPQVTYRVGVEAAKTTKWNKSTDSKASFYKENYNSTETTLQFIQKLCESNRFIAQVTPYGENPITSEFDTTGLRQEIEEYPHIKELIFQVVSPAASYVYDEEP